MLKRVLLAAIVVMAFSPVLYNGFIAVTDDWVNILGHHHELKRVWTEFYSAFYIPVPYTVWTLLWKMRAEPWAFHLVGLTVHGLTALLVFELLKLYYPKHAFIGALFWALHPFNVEVVAWASGLRDGLSGFFLFAALFAYLKKKDGVSFALGLLAVLSKPGAVVLLPLAFILKPSKRVFYLTPLAAVALASVALQDAPDYTWAARLNNASDALRFYIFGAPSADHWVRVGEFSPVGVGVLLGAVWSRGLRLYVAALLPVLGLVPFAYQYWSNVADRYAYVPLFGVAFTLMEIFKALDRKPDYLKIVQGLIAFLILQLAVTSFDRTKLWKDVWTLHTAEIYWCPPAPASWWRSKADAEDDKSRAAAQCEYRVKANSAMVLSLYLRNEGHAQLADVYALEAKTANDYAEAGLARVNAYQVK